MSNTATTDIAPGREVAEIKRSPIVLVGTGILDDTGKFEHMSRVALMMSQAKLVPEHLRASPADCFLICNQADRWQMDCFMVAQKTFSIKGRLGYEGQLVAAVINSRAGLVGRLNTTFDGEGAELTCTVTGQFANEQEPREKTSPPLKQITVRNSPLWAVDPQQQLAYWTQRAWARLHAPDVILGVYTPDELESIDYQRTSDGSYSPPGPIPPRPTREQFTAGTGDAVVTDADAEKEEKVEKPQYELADESGVIETTVHTPDEWGAAYLAATAPTLDGAYTQKARLIAQNNADTLETILDDMSQEVSDEVTERYKTMPEPETVEAKRAEQAKPKAAAAPTGPQMIVMPMKGRNPHTGNYVAMFNGLLEVCTTEAECDALERLEEPNIGTIPQGPRNGIRIGIGARKVAIRAEAQA